MSWLYRNRALSACDPNDGDILMDGISKAFCCVCKTSKGSLLRYAYTELHVIGSHFDLGRSLPTQVSFFFKHD